MRIALINENSQAPKNAVIYEELKRAADLHGYEVDNYGMYSADDPGFLTYVQCGILAGILLNSGVADFVVTGCGTGEGACLALNAFPGVQCGHIVDAPDAYLFSQINAGNAVSLPYAKDFGWGGELKLRYMFEKLFEAPAGGGYPKERAEAEQNNKKILDAVKKITHRDMVTILSELDPKLAKGAVSGTRFQELFFANCKDEAIADAVRALLAKEV